MAAELSTGALAMANVAASAKPVSMLVLKVESEYMKKATASTVFTCNDGDLFERSIAECIKTGGAIQVRAGSVGKNPDGEIIATFFITWSFKVKK
jgi:hypothetical protein